MYSLNQDPSTLSLKEVNTKFEHWRSTRTKRTRIPSVLWQQVLILLNKHSIGQLTKILRISSRQIKIKMKQYSANPKHKTIGKSTDFIAIDVPSLEPLPPYILSKMEIRRPDGAVLVIEHLNPKLFSDILTQFMEDLKC